MRANRMFFSQDAVDRWLEAGQASLDGDVLALSSGPRFRLSGGVVFTAEVASGVDALELCGKVKSVAEIEALQGELVTGSVLIGEHAYEVTDGFVAELLDAMQAGEAAHAVGRIFQNR